MPDTILRLSPRTAAIVFSRHFPLKREHAARLFAWIDGLQDEQGAMRPVTPIDVVDACREAIEDATIDDLVRVLAGPSLFPGEGEDFEQMRLSIASRAFLVALLTSDISEALEDVDALEPDALVGPFLSFVSDWVALIAAHTLLDIAYIEHASKADEGGDDA